MPLVLTRESISSLPQGDTFMYEPLELQVSDRTHGAGAGLRDPVCVCVLPLLYAMINDSIKRINYFTD